MISEYLKEYLNSRIELMKKRKPKSYTNRIRKHECQYLLNEINKLENKIQKESK